MADEIKQVLGFDASQALDALGQIDKAFNTMQTRLNSTVASLGDFNSRAGKTVAALKQIKSNAEDAAKALSKLDGAQKSTTKSADSAAKSSTKSGKLLKGQNASDALDALLGVPTKQQAAQAQNAANSIISATRQIGAASKSNLGAAAQSAQKFTITWETLVRVVQTQLIVRALSQLRDAFRAAVGDASEFQTAVARIQTISPGSTFQQVAAGVRDVSDSFNIPLLEAAEGVYQAISNQVGNLGESLEFTATAAKFAKATNSTLAQSIDLISGAIKSFNLSTEDAERVASVFFVAIDKGRVTAEELSNTFGRVGPAAENIGVDLEEFAGAIASISIRGVKTNEALTQFRGIVTALTKPTEAMKEALAEMGFTSVETAVQALRLDGLLDALAQSTGGSAQAMAKLFPEVRGLGGALSVTGANLKDFAANIRAGKDVVDDFSTIKFGTVFQTDAEKVGTAVNKLKNVLIVDFGQSVLKTAANSIELIGGVEGLGTALKFLTPAFIQAAVAIGGTIVAIQALKVAALAASTSLGPLLIAIAAIAALPAIKNFIDEKRLEDANKKVAALEALNAKNLASFKLAERQTLDESRKTREKIVQINAKASAEIQKQYLKDVEAAKAANEQLVQNTEDALGKIVSTREGFLNALQQGIDRSTEQVQESQQRIKDFRLQKQDLNFENQTKNLGNAQKVFAFTQRGASLARQAAEDLNAAFKSGNDAELAAAQSLFDKAEQQINAAQSAAAGDRSLEARVFNEQNALLDTRIAAEERINALQVERQAALKAERDKQQEIVKQIKAQLKIATDNTGLFNEKDEPFDQKKLAEREAKRQAALKKIVELGINTGDLDAAKALGLAEFLQKLQNEATKTPIQIAFDVESSIQKLQQEMNKSLAQVDIRFPFRAALEKQLGRSLLTEPDGIQKGLTEASAKAGELQEKLSQVRVNDESIKNLRAEVQQLLTDIESRKGIRDAAMSGDEEETAKAANFDTLVQKLKTLSQQTNITTEELASIKAEMGTLLAPQTAAFSSDIDALGRLSDKVRQIKEQMQQKVDLAIPPDAVAQLQQLTSILDQAEATGGAQALLVAAGQAGVTLASATERTQTATAQANTNTTNLKSQMTLTANEAERAAKASAQISASAARGGGPGGRATKALGGMIQGFNAGGLVKQMRYFSEGGFAPRGTDTIPAMLSPGEFVVNAASTRKFFSQLQAMNAGINPIYRAGGGSVTNNNFSFGDITVNGGSNDKGTARNIMTEFRRELRRTTGRL